MNRIEALKILGLESSATDDEAKKRFRELSKTKHPDKCKDPGAEEEYKKLSEAFTYLKNPKPEPTHQGWPGGFGGFSGFGGFNNINLNDFFRQHQRHVYKPEPINIPISLSFKESVLGCKKKLIFDRTGPCPKCKGIGHDPCLTCNGMGFLETINRQGNMMFSSRAPCPTCNGKRHNDVLCVECNGKKTKAEHIEAEVNIVGGVQNGQVIRLQGAGNVIADENGIAQGDVFLKTSVESNSNMTIAGVDVISTIKITLYDALKGVAKKVETVKGDTTIMINARSKHRDQVKLSGYGVDGKGSHIFTIEVEYPETSDGLIKFLETIKEE